VFHQPNLYFVRLSRVTSAANLALTSCKIIQDGNLRYLDGLFLYPFFLLSLLMFLSCLTAQPTSAVYI